MRKTFALLAAAVICGSVNAETVKMLTFGQGAPGIEEPGMMGEGLSADGKYICGALQEGTGYFVGNLETDEFRYALSEDPEGAELRNIDSNGLAIGFNGPGVTYSIDGVETVLATPEGYKYVLGEDISNDGSVMVGSLVGTGYVTSAAFSKDGGEWTNLPMPSDEILGAYAKTKTSAAKYVSGDGKVILGFVGSFGPAVLWEMNEAGEYEVDPLYHRYLVNGDSTATGPKFASLSPLNISNNGKYVLLQGNVMVDDDIFNSVTVAAVYDTETSTMKIYDESQEIDQAGLGLRPVAIADDGTFIGVIGQPLMGSTGTFIMKAGETQAEAMITAFPAYAEMFGMCDQFGFSVPMAISADGKVIMGYGFYCEDYFAEEAIPFYATWVINVDGTTSINSVVSESAQEAIYSIEGYRLNEMKPGLNIVRKADGSVVKVMKR